MCCPIGERRWTVIGTGSASRVRMRFRNLHGMHGPRIVRRQWNFEEMVRIVITVAEPVMHHELNPGAREQIQRRGGLELIAGEQLQTDCARVWVENGSF